MSDSEMNQDEKTPFDWTAALRWGLGSAVANAVIALVLGFWQGTSNVNIAAITATSVAVGVVNGATIAQYISASLPYARLRAGHWLVVAVAAVSVGLAGSYLFDATFILGAALNYAMAVVVEGIPAGYFFARLWAARPVAPEGHPDNIDF